MFHDTHMGAGWYRRLDGIVSRGWNNERGVIRAIEAHLGRRYDETSFFSDVVGGFAVRHVPWSSGFTVLRRLDGDTRLASDVTPADATAAMASTSPLADDTLALAAGFPAPDRAAWLALVEKTLKGAPLEGLTRRTLDGLPIEPLYEACVDAPPVVRATAGWDVRTVVARADPALANGEALADLAQGANSLLLRLGATGETGIVVGSADDLARVLEGVMLDVAPVALDAGLLGPKAADWLGAAAKDAPAAPLLVPKGTLQSALRARRAQPRPDGGAHDRRRHRGRAPRRYLS